MKRGFVPVLVAVLILGSMSPALADFLRDGDWEYCADGANATITRYYGNDRYLVIPSVLGGLTVTTIGSMAMQLSSDRDDAISPVTITVPGTVKVIENANFVGYNSLTTIELPEGLQSIGDDCFSYCGSLEAIRIPSSVTGLGGFLFDYCDRLTVEAYAGSVAEKLCIAEGIPYKIIGGERLAAAVPQAPFVEAAQAPHMNPPVDPKVFHMQTFDEFHFKRNQMLNIYTGPGYDYYRSSNGKAAASTNGQIYVFGWDGQWLLVLYGTGSGLSRYGYVNRSDFSDDVGGIYLESANLNASIAATCMISDCMPDDHSYITTLNPGTPVKYIAYNPDFDWAYIEVNADVGLVRGFVPYNCLGF